MKFKEAVKKCIEERKFMKKFKEAVKKCIEENELKKIRDYEDKEGNEQINRWLAVINEFGGVDKTPGIVLLMSCENASMLQNIICFMWVKGE